MYSIKPITHLIVWLILGGSIIFWFGFFVTQHSSYLIISSSPKEEIVTQDPDPLVLLFVGDIMLDRGVEYKIKQHNNDWKWPFYQIADTFAKADLVFGNLESPISDKGEKVGSIYSFRAEPASIEGLVYAGFDVLSVSNNHSFDYGVQAFKDTLVRLQNKNIAYVGGIFSREQDPLFVQQVKDTSVGFLAYTNKGSPYWQATETIPGIGWVDYSNLDEIKKEIEKAQEQVDILVVSIHAGIEYQTEPTEFQQLFSKTAIDAGASLVIGHHPHVVQLIERYKQGWIAYSLGNFIFDQSFSTETMEGLLLKVLVQGKAIQEVIPIPTYLTEEFQVTLYPARTTESI